ncbi:translation factor SUA5 [Laceyella tengchongensis]|uniref:Threonylcarbamoyl-AMP synthase n=1 Tax=Laceyella tengchongensis TaxID=574699 RepID=A0AA45WQJ5_9BACL|nr:translation factor SUA5 [Laceyella tengchongensis]
MEWIETRLSRVVDEGKGIEELRGRVEIQEAANILKRGGLVAFPTETVYGLGAIATSADAVSSIYKAKGRPSDNPLIIHLGAVEQVGDWVESIPPIAAELARRFWPGPLTMVFRHRGNLASNVTAGLPTVAVRVPDHPLAQALLLETGIPVAAPSANRSGRPSPTEALHVWDDLRGKVALILDGGATGYGLESTVVDVTGEVPVLLRPGGVTLEQLQAAVGTVEVDPGLVRDDESPRSPGMKYRHYAPEGDVWLVREPWAEVKEALQREISRQQGQGHRVGLLVTEEHSDLVTADVIVRCGWRRDPLSVARGLYHALREFDEQQVDVIFAETFPEEGIYRSVMNRLAKAAAGKTLDLRK